MLHLCLTGFYLRKPVKIGYFGGFLKITDPKHRDAVSLDITLMLQLPLEAITIANFQIFQLLELQHSNN